jgi:hypothetical protein
LLKGFLKDGKNFFPRFLEGDMVVERELCNVFEAWLQACCVNAHLERTYDRRHHHPASPDQKLQSDPTNRLPFASLFSLMGHGKRFLTSFRHAFHSTPTRPWSSGRLQSTCILPTFPSRSPASRVLHCPFRTQVGQIEGDASKEMLRRRCFEGDASKEMLRRR